MAATAIDTIVAQLRLMLRDTGKTFSTQVVGDGATKIYKLPIENIEAGYANGTPPIAAPAVAYLSPLTGLALGPDYSMDYEHGYITLINPSLSGRTLEIDGYFYQKYTTTALMTFVTTASLQHLHNRVDKYNQPMTLTAMPVVEQYLVAILGLIQALWDMATESAQEIDVVIPDGITIPRGERFRQILQIIEAWQGRYNEMAALLNVGLSAIEMFDLRRVSQTTGRLVPIFKDREYNQPNSPFYPTNASPGVLVTIIGSFFSGATAVTVNGVSATFTVGDDHTITFTVPVGATTGPVAVTTPGGTVTTATSLQIGVQPPTLTYGPQQVFPRIDPLDTDPGDNPSYATGYTGP